MIPFFVFLFCLCATYATYLLVTGRSAARRAQLERRLSDVLTYSTGIGDAQVRLGREDLLSEIPRLDQWLRRLPQAGKLRRTIEQSGLHLTVMRLFMFSALACLSAVLAVSMISSSSILAATCGVAAASGPSLHMLWKRKKRLDKFLKYLPEALDLMGRALAAGHAFTEALHIISIEMAEPIATEFRRTYEEQNLGLSLKLALDSLSERVPLIDLRLCITAILIQRETGGNLAEILEKVAYTIRERFRILEDLKTLTTSSRWSAWVLCGIPIFIGASVSFVNPEYMSILWIDPRGHKMITAAIAMQLMGIFVVRRTLQIKI